MKKIYSGLKVIKSDSFDKISSQIELKFPFDSTFINLLKKENLFPQEYYFIRDNDDFAFFISYKIKLNIFTFGKFKLNVWGRVIGMPCSISENGYYTNNEEMMVEFIKTIKGAKLILNVKKPIQVDDISVGNTLPTCIFVNDFENIDAYMSSLRSSYRRRINKAIKNCKDITIKRVSGKCHESLYELYLSTYKRSAYKLEKLEPGFFDKVDAEKIVFSRSGTALEGETALGFVLLRQYHTKLYFMLCGMNYEVDTADLYYYMLFNIIVYAIEHKCIVIDFGQTSEETKLKMGAQLSERYFYAHHTNKFLNKIINKAKSLLEYKYRFPNYRVYKGGLRYEGAID